MTANKNTTYIFDSREWYITGRQAVKDLRSGNNKKMVEIRLIEAPDDDDKSYNRWVFPSDLYLVEREPE